MSKVRVPVFGAPLKSVSFDPSATNGAVIGVNLFDQTGKVFDLNTAIKNAIAANGGSGSGGSSSGSSSGISTTDDLPQGAFNLYMKLASPSVTVGLTVKNGSALTAMRSDAAPALDQTISPTWTGTHSFSQVVTGVTPTAAAHLTTKAYVDQIAQGISWKAPVKAASTVNLTLSGTQTVDGIALVAGDRCLVKDQTATAANGIYVVSATAWTRALDMDVWAEVPNATAYVMQGTVNADTAFVCTADAGGTLGTTPITFVLMSSGAGGVASFNSRTGAVTFLASDIPASGVSAGIYGDGSHIPVVTVGADGRLTAVSTVAVGGGSSYDAAVLADTPLGYWKMADISGTVCTDSSGNGKNGVYNGGFTLLGANGPASLTGAVLLNGSSGFIKVPADASFAVGNNWTVEGWTLLNQVTSGSALIAEFFTGGSNPIGFGTGINPTGVGTFVNQLCGGYYTGSAWINTTGPVALQSVLYHLVTSYDGTTIRTYLNGALIATAAGTGHVASGDGIVMGASTPGTSSFLNGVLSCCALYGTTLSPARIKAHYLAGR